MSFHSVEQIATFEQFNLDFDPSSWVRTVNHHFDEVTSIVNVHQPGLYISMIGKCQCQTLNKGMDRQKDYSHNYMVALVDESCPSYMNFPSDSTWQTFSIHLSLDHLEKRSILPELTTNVTHNVPQVRLAEAGPIPVDILQCCEAVWDCELQGFERELFIKAKAQEVLALFLHQHRLKSQATKNIRIDQLNHALNHIQMNLQLDWPLSAVARLAGSNRTYVKQDIKQLLGMSFRDWLRKIRIETAQKRLASSQPITDIAHDIGFKSQAHFATLFKSEVGVTPSEYRQALFIRHSA